MAFAYFLDRPLRFLVCAGIGVYVGCRFPYGPFPYIDSFIKRLELDESSKAYNELRAKREKAKIEMARICQVIREKGEAANSMTLGELAEGLKDFGGVWSNLAESKGRSVKKD